MTVSPWELPLSRRRVERRKWVGFRLPSLGRDRPGSVIRPLRLERRHWRYPNVTIRLRKYSSFSLQFDTSRSATSHHHNSAQGIDDMKPFWSKSAVQRVCIAAGKRRGIGSGQVDAGRMQRLSFPATQQTGHACSTDARTQRTGIGRLRAVGWRRKLLSIGHPVGGSAPQVEIPCRLSRREREGAHDTD